MEFGWLSLIPALVTILVALSTKRVALALFLGVVAGAFTIHSGAFPESLLSLWDYLVLSFTDAERLRIVLFILLIGGLLEIIRKSGGYEAFAGRLSKRLKNGRRSRIMTWGISMMLFFDDYANVLISGASMRNINKRNGVSPALLAYIVDVVAVMASVMIISTWAAFEGATMVDAAEKIDKEGTLTFFFLKSLPYHFYTYLAIILAFVVAFTGKWFGYRMDNKLYENDAKENNGKNGKASYVLVPVITLIGFAIIGLFVSGTYFLLQDGQSYTLINILGNAPSVDVLILSTIMAILVLLIMLFRDKKLEGNEGKSLLKGMRNMVDVSLVIFMATGLAAVSSDLGTGMFITDSFSGYITPQFLPVLIFVISMLITVATGFSWSSMAIVMPIAYQMAAAEGMSEIIPILSAAVVSGAVSGEHMIPYSEKAVITSAACRISPVYHIRTQIFQTLTVFAGGVISFILIGFHFSLILSFLAGLAFILIMHFVFARKAEMKTK